MTHRILNFGKLNFVLVVLLLSTAACSGMKGLPEIDETGNETATQPDDNNGGLDEEIPRGPAAEQQKLVLNSTMNIRYEAAGVLEWKAELPVGSQIEIPESYQIKNLDFRNSSGGLDRSSTGFITPVKLVSVPPGFEATWSASKIQELNNTQGGLYIGASIVGVIQGVQGNFAALFPAALGTGFTKYFNSNGKPKFNFLTAVNNRFGARLNKGLDPSTMSAADKVKYQKIYDELKKAVDRTIEVKKSYLMIDQAEATKWSKDYEATGAVAPMGAWTIAVNATAVRHGFPNVPCAEFQSEILREAYQRAGYPVANDFNTTKGNKLIWTNTASVVGFSKALYTAGWVPWDPNIYRPIVGAFMMHGSGQSPGHTYISGGDDGRFIVDNGTPQGRDMRKTSQSTIEMMYQTGVFFLPPGINPPKW